MKNGPVILGVRRRVSKGVEDGRRPPALRGVEGLGTAGPGETLGSQWPPFAIRLCLSSYPVVWLLYYAALCRLQIREH
jgi:hypothetical protein